MKGNVWAEVVVSKLLRGLCLSWHLRYFRKEVKKACNVQYVNQKECVGIKYTEIKQLTTPTKEVSASREAEGTAGQPTGELREFTITAKCR